MPQAATWLTTKEAPYQRMLYRLRPPTLLGVVPAATTLVNVACTALQEGMGGVVTAVCEPNVAAVADSPQIWGRTGGMLWWLSADGILAQERLQWPGRLQLQTV